MKREIDLARLPIRGTLKEMADHSGLPIHTLRIWLHKKRIEAVWFAPNDRGRPSTIVRGSDVRLEAWDCGLLHNWFGFKRCCRCRSIYAPAAYRSGYCTKCRRLKQTEQRKANPEAYKATARRYYETPAGRERINMQSRIQRSKRRAMTKGAKTAGDKVLPKGWSVKGKRCYWCNKPLRGKFHIDHIVPLSKGGDHANYNIVASCPVCNMAKSNKHPNEFAEGQLEIPYA